MSLSLALAHAIRNTSPHHAFTETCLWELPHGAECGRVITDDPFFCPKHDADAADHGRIDPHEHHHQHHHQRDRAIDAGHDYLA